MATWKVLRWDSRPEHGRYLPLTCNHCDYEADCPVGEHPGGLVIAIIGMGIIFDPPGYHPGPNFMPQELQCRNCRRIYSSDEEAEDVR